MKFVPVFGGGDSHWFIIDLFHSGNNSNSHGN